MGRKLRNLRIKSRKSLKDISEALGVSVNTVCRWEHDLSEPRKASLAKLAGFYGVSISFLLSDGGYEEGIPYINDLSCRNENVDEQISGLVDKLPAVKKFQVLGYTELMYSQEWWKQIKKK